MIASHRKGHLFVWLAIGIVLPVLTIAAYLLTPKFPVHDFSEQHIAFPELKRSVVSAEYVYNIKKNYEGGSILEVIQISGFNPASELVMISYSKKFGEQKTQKILGMMGGQARYLFNLQDIEPPFSIIVKDTIRQTVLSRVDF